MRIFVKVKSNSKEKRVVKISEDSLIVYVKSPPTKGKANKELIEVLSEYFNINKSEIRIVSGNKRRNKIIEILSK